MEQLPNMEWTLKFQGAESKIWFGKAFNQRLVKKERFIKTYRAKNLDILLTKSRINAEVRALIKLKKDCNELKELIPTIYFINDREIIMNELVNCKPLSEYLKNQSFEDSKWIYKKLGEVIALIHKNNIVHGDITTSNFLITQNKQIIPIDFGLSSFNETSEQLAVDLYVLERSLLTNSIEHYKGLDIILDSYKEKLGSRSIEIFSKLDEVRLRGRKRNMAG